MLIFSIYDSKAEAFLRPFFCPKIGLAVREFEAEANNEGSNLYKWPADYTLFQIGEFDEGTGTIRSLETKRSIGTALEFRKAVSGNGAEILNLDDKRK